MELLEILNIIFTFAKLSGWLSQSWYTLAHTTLINYESCHLAFNIAEATIQDYAHERIQEMRGSMVMELVVSIVDQGVSL